VLHDDTIIYENYFNSFNKDSIFTSFSVAKSFVSILVGLAISDGFINSVDDKITTYLPELLEKDTRFAGITINDLLSMSSGIDYSVDGFPSDDDITYVSPDLRKATFENIRIIEQPGEKWLYNNYNPLLLGIILERTTGMTVSKYAEDRLWKKMGGENASWSLDEHGFEKMESGINCTAYDYARFAVLLLNKGKYKDEQVIPEAWVQRATQPQKRTHGYYDYLLENNVYYSYFWWGKFRNNQENANDFFGLGNKGEYLYICPQKKLIIIRLGFEYGFTPGPFSWPEMFYQFATSF
jgi:CubicO group peptidase (beta-lactamase class C family)